MRTKFVAMLAPALALGVLAVSAEAQQHRATRLGNPATRFAKPIRQADDVRVLVRGDRTKADVAAILNEVGWKGSIEDLDRAAATAEISEVQVPTGTHLPFMASRMHGRPHALVDVLWAGRQTDRRAGVRVLLELRALSPRDAQGLRQLLDRKPRQGRRRPEVRSPCPRRRSCP